MQYELFVVENYFWLISTDNNLFLRGQFSVFIKLLFVKTLYIDSRSFCLKNVFKMFLEMFDIFFSSD